jgi:hypothetical protein
MSEPIPYREGEPAPGPEYVLARLRGEDGSEQMVWIRPEELKQGPIQHQHLDELLPILRWQWRHVGDYATWCRSFEDWELGFMRDEHPGTEVGIFARATYAFLEFSHRNPRIEKSKVFSAVIAIINGQADKVKPRAVAEKLQKLLSNTPAELADIKSFTSDGRFTAGDKHLR